MEAQSDKNFAHFVDNSEAQKCKFCGSETTGGEVCYSCYGNETRQQWFLRIREKNAKQQQNENFSIPKSAYTDEDEQINLYRLANTILYESPIITDKHTYMMYRFNEKIWVNDAEAHIHKRLVEVAEAEYKPYHLTTLSQIIQGLTFAELVEPEPNLICFENGILDLNTMTLKPHSSEYFFRNMIKAEYKPEVKAEAFLKWLSEVLPDADSQKTVQEMFGYCLLRDYPLHHLFFLVGSGRNGRSTLLRTLEALLGKENCASVPLELLPERFQVTNLIGKLVNVVSEPRSKRMLDTPILKKLTGGDLIEAEVKGKQKTLRFSNYAKIVVLANELPPVRDDSYGWWERVIIVEFPISIPEDKRIPNIEERWLTNPEERSGIVNWALEGLKRIMANSRFTKTEAMHNQIEQYKRWSNPAQYFLDKYCVYEPNAWITKKNLYEAYKRVCEEEGLQILSEEAFAKEARKKPRVSMAQKRIQTKIERIWVGIQLKEDSEAGEASEAGKFLLGKISEANKFLKSNEIPASPASVASAYADASNASFRKSIGENRTTVDNSKPEPSQINPPNPPRDAPSISEVYDVLRKQLTVPFYDHRAVTIIMHLRKCDQEEAWRILQTLIDEGKVFRNNYGLWEMVK